MRYHMYVLYLQFLSCNPPSPTPFLDLRYRIYTLYVKQPLFSNGIRLLQRGNRSNWLLIYKMSQVKRLVLSNVKLPKL